MPFNVKTLLAVLGLGGAAIIGSWMWSDRQPCTTTAEDGTVTTVPCTSSSSRRGLRSIFNSRSTTGGGTDVGK